MFLALAFGLFLGAPLVLLVASLGRTVMGVDRAGAVDAPVPVPMAAPALQKQAPRVRRLSAVRPGRRTRPAVAGGSRRDYFGDTMVPGGTLVATASAVSRPIGAASAAGADVLAFRGRGAQMPSFGDASLQTAGTGA